MRRHEVWLAVVINAMAGALACVVAHAYAVEGHLLPLEFGQRAIVIAVVLMGFGVSGAALLGGLKR